MCSVDGVDDVLAEEYQSVVTTLTEVIDDDRDGRGPIHPPIAVQSTLYELMEQFAIKMGEAEGVIEQKALLLKAMTITSLLGHRLAKKEIYFDNLHQCGCLTVSDEEIDLLLNSST